MKKDTMNMMEHKKADIETTIKMRLNRIYKSGTNEARKCIDRHLKNHSVDKMSQEDLIALWREVRLIEDIEEIRRTEYAS